jgi:hypothetical protein
MIQLNDLREELVEVPDNELGLVVGGGLDDVVGGVDFRPSPSSPTVDIPIGGGVGVTLPTSGSIPPEFALKVPQLNYNIGNGTTVSANGSGTFGLTVEKNPFTVTASGNPSVGSTGIKFGYGINF